MLLKKGNIIQVTSNEAPITIKIDGAQVRTYPKGSLIIDNAGTLRMMGDEIVDDSENKRVHLWLVIEDIPKVGDLVLRKEVPEEVTEEGNGEKELILIASTDKTHKLRKISKNFLRKYVELQGIVEVNVVFYEKHDNEGNTVFIPKTNKAGFISLKKAGKVIYDRLAVHRVVMDAFRKFGKKSVKEATVQTWLDEYV